MSPVPFDSSLDSPFDSTFAKATADKSAQDDSSG